MGRSLDPEIDREAVLDKTNGVCIYCGCELGSYWHVDHVTPVSKGGRDEMVNLVPSCPSCNSRKSNTDFDAMRFNQGIRDSKRPFFSRSQREWLLKHGFDIDAVCRLYERPLHFETDPALLEIIEEAYKL